MEEEKRKHRCPQCNAAFHQAHGVKVHMHTVHEKRRDYACPHCAAAFGVASTRLSHMRTQHPNEHAACVAKAAEEKRAKWSGIAAKVRAEAKAAEEKRAEHAACEERRVAKAAEEAEAEAAFATALTIAAGIAAEPGRTRSNAEVAATFNARLLTQEQLVEVR